MPRCKLRPSVVGSASHARIQASLQRPTTRSHDAATPASQRPAHTYIDWRLDLQSPQNDGLYPKTQGLKAVVFGTLGPGGDTIQISQQGDFILLLGRMQAMILDMMPSTPKGRAPNLPMPSSELKVSWEHLPNCTPTGHL